MDKQTDLKAIVYIIKETVKGYYGIIYRDTNSYKIEKFKKKEFIDLFSSIGSNWIVESDGDLARFLLCADTDTTSTDSDILKTFNAYDANGEVRIASISIVCDWSLFELAFEEKSAEEVLKMALNEKK